MKAAGGNYLTGRKETNPNVYYEVKYTTPEGIVFDITESGWKGAVKEVTPATEGGGLSSSLASRRGTAALPAASNSGPVISYCGPTASLQSSKVATSKRAKGTCRGSWGNVYSGIRQGTVEQSHASLSAGAALYARARAEMDRAPRPFATITAAPPQCARSGRAFADALWSRCILQDPGAAPAINPMIISIYHHR